jgi:Fe-S cluster biogenesis protein NfuA
MLLAGVRQTIIMPEVRGDGKGTGARASLGVFGKKGNPNLEARVSGACATCPVMRIIDE